MASLDSFRPSLQEVLDAALAAHGVPGATVGILRGEDRVVVAGGLANATTGVETTRDTLFQIGSISKAYTATLIMQLVHAGLIELDEPVRGALQEFRVADDSATLTITPRHLLSHTSGIQGDHFLDCGRNPDALWRYVSTLDEVGQVHPPDDLYSYCNTGFGVLGRLIEEATGDHFAWAFSRRLLRPLGLRRTLTSAEQAIVHRAAAGHQDTEDGLAVVPWAWAPFTLPAGGIVADADDLLTFAGLHLRGGKSAEGKQIVPSRAITEMRTGQVDVPGRDEQRGLGWRILKWGDRQVVGHDGDTLGQRAFLRVIPEDDVALVILTNHPKGDHVADDVVRTIARELLHIDLPIDPEPLPLGDGPDPDRCAGIYERMHQRLAIAGGAEGTLRMTVIPDDLFASAGLREHTIVLRPVDDVRWLGVHPTTDVAVIVTMVHGDDGRPEYVYFGGRAHSRLA